jgi:hypothetical protein
MTLRWKMAISLLATHVLLLPQFMSLNQRLPKDLLILRSELVLQLILLGLVVLFLTAIVLLLGGILSKMPDPMGPWAWPLLGAVVLGRLVTYAVKAAFPLANLHLGVNDLVLALVIPALTVLMTGLLSQESAAKWVSMGNVLGLFTLAGLWLPLPSALLTWSARRTPAPVQVQRQAQDPAVWVFIFDELDGGLAWDRGLSPRLCAELDVWSAQSFTCRNALRAGPSTQTAISGMLLGRPLLGSSTFSLGGLGLNLKEINGTSTRWNGSGSLFHAWFERGGSIRVLGWFFPYETWFGNFSSLAVQYPAHFGKKGYHLHEHLWSRFVSTIKNCFVESPYSRTEAVIVGREYAKFILADLEGRVAQLQKEDHQGLTWIHWPVPHPPALHTGGREGYAGNLDLVAEVLEKFRIAQMTTGAWDRDIVIVTGDHGLRPENYAGFFNPTQGSLKIDGGQHVPFLCRLPGMNSGRNHTDPISVAGIRQLVLAIQAGQVKSYDDVEAWARTQIPSTPPSR